MNQLQKLADLKSALVRLKEGVAAAKTELDRDGVIQRFEFTFELVWKVIQEFGTYKGVEVVSPRDSFRVAAELGIIDSPTIWFDFLKDRNLSTHVYSEKDAADIFSHIPSFATETEKLISKIEQSI